MFHIKTCDDLVAHSSKMLPIKELVAEGKAKDPEVSIAYHSMFEIPSKDKHAFGVKQEHEILFIPAFTSDEDGGQSQPVMQATVAGKLLAKSFEGSH